MMKRNCKTRREVRNLSKCINICRSFNRVQYVFADKLERDDEVKEFECNVPLQNLNYTTDFLVTMKNGEKKVYECVKRDHLTKPLDVKILDISRTYWLRRGVEWGVVTSEEE